MKTCAQCQGRLGLGVRSRNVWTGHWWAHLRFCSIRCEALHELQRREARAQPPAYFCRHTRRAKHPMFSQRRASVNGR
jgi:hypothetical protein